MPPQEELATFGSLEGLDDARIELLRSRAVDQPFGAFTSPLRLENPAREALPKVGILCSFSLEEVQALIASGNPLFRELAARTGGSSSSPRGTIRCSQDQMIWRRCSSTSRLVLRTTSEPLASENGPTSRCVHE
jgi:hypothetical protein